MSNKFIPSEDLNKLLEGSYEQLAVSVKKAVTESASRLTGEKVTLELIGTFKNYAVVQTEDKERAYRLRYEYSESREIILVDSEIIEAKSYTNEQYIAKKAKQFVEDYFNGSRTSATSALKTLVPLIAERKAPAKPNLTPVQKFEDTLCAEKTWKKVFESHLVDIKGAIKEDLANLESSTLKTKFKKLRDGSITESRLASYRNLVTSDLKYITDKVTNLESEVRTAYEALSPAIKAESSFLGKDFASLADDYLKDLANVKDSLVGSTNSVNNVDELSNIYDLLASELPNYEIAGKFIHKMSSDLNEKAAVTEVG